MNNHNLSEIAQRPVRSPEPEPGYEVDLRPGAVNYAWRGHPSWGHIDGDERWWDDVMVPGWVLFLVGLGAGVLSMFALWLVL